MKILQVDITNFRQYRGHHKIVMSIDRKKHITVIQGDNGRGKSNIMNAITWCLYGVELITSKENTGLKIVNEREVYSNKTGRTLCEVSVTVGYNSPAYIFTRSQEFSILGNVIMEQTPKLRGFSITKEKGTSQLGDPEFYINAAFIPETLKNFFFFDGEKLFEHFQDTQKLKAYIEDLSQIEVLNRALITANEVKKAIRNEQSKVGGGETILAEYNELEVKIKNNKRLHDDAEKRKNELEDEIAQKDEFLRRHSNTRVKELQDKRRELESKRTRENKRKIEIETKLRSFLGNLIAPLYAARALSKTRDIIDENTQKGVLPPKIKDTFLKDLLETGKCICGRDLEEGSECRRTLENLLSEMVASDIATDAVGGKYVISTILSKLNFEDEYIRLSEDYEDADRELEAIKTNLAEVSEQLSSLNVEEISKAENERSCLARDRDNYVADLREYSKAIAIAERKRETLKHTVDDINKKNKRAGELYQQKNYIEEIIEKIEFVKHSLVEDVRIQLQSGVRKYYAEMVSKTTDDTMISILDVGGHYRLSVKSEHNNEKIGSLSAGEKQVLALAMTAAMYKICKVDAPVLIDTPMGRISGDARDNISSYLPHYLEDTQLIFLPTDTEYTPNVREKLLPYIGKEYRIRYDNEKKESEVIDYE